MSPTLINAHAIQSMIVNCLPTNQSHGMTATTTALF